MFYVLVDREQQAVFPAREDALVEAAQLDYLFNSPELNDGITGSRVVEILSFAEMMAADDVTMVI